MAKAQNDDLTKSETMKLWRLIRPTAWTFFGVVSRAYLALGRRYRYVFILGHMRSGSTLLAHILANHPDFAGAGETHIAYRTSADLPTLVLKTCELLHRPILRTKNVVDQINHDYVANDVLTSNCIYRCIILIREPEETLKSMLSLSIWSEKEALNAYVKRLEELYQYGLLLRKKAFLLEYGELVEHSQKTLSALTLFLGLDVPLTPTYATHRMTRRTPGFGDPSSNIQAGQIIRTPKHNIAMAQDTLTEARLAFRKCRDRLRSIVVLE